MIELVNLRYISENNARWCNENRFASYTILPVCRDRFFFCRDNLTSLDFFAFLSFVDDAVKDE